MSDEEKCSTCIWRKRDGKEWICMNEDSDCYGAWALKGDACEEWEGKE